MEISVCCWSTVRSRSRKTCVSSSTFPSKLAARVAACCLWKVEELTQVLRDRERTVDQQQTEISKQQELLEHDRDIRELMGARDLYIAEVYDVARTGQTNKTYGRVFYTRGKSLICACKEPAELAGIDGIA